MYDFTILRSIIEETEKTRLINRISMRLRFFICALIAAMVRLRRTAPPAFAQKLEKLVIGYPAPVASLGIIDVMRKGGLFKKNGLDVDLVYIQGSPILTDGDGLRPGAAELPRRRGDRCFRHRRR